MTTEFKNQPDQILIVYHMDRGQKHKVSSILFHGNYAISAEELMPQVAVKKSLIWTHGSLSEKLLKQSGNNVEALYRDRGYEQIKVTSQAVVQGNKTEVVFKVQEGPQTLVGDVQVTGNQHMAYGQLTAPTGFLLQPGKPFSPRKLAEDRNRMSANYLDRGYLNAEVKATAEKMADPQRVLVKYAITENQSVRVSQVVDLGQDHTKQWLLSNATHPRPEDANAAFAATGNGKPPLRSWNLRLGERGTSETDYESDRRNGSGEGTRGQAQRNYIRLWI